ncbi:MAG: FAD-dependent oxidoreductase [Solirubrobacterales bacterium]|nr:FAD-dependent oxidoreductase [Solirubrobacterales bacterium]
MDRGRLSRRELIGAGAALAGGIAVAPALAGCSDGDSGGAASRGRVVVVGGGLAGLTAGYELGRKGFDVQLVEARDRLGGRVHTVRSFTSDQHGEAGAEAIDTKHREILRLCRRFGLPLENAYSGYGNRRGTVYRRGRNFLPREFATPAVKAEMERFWRAVDRLAEPLDGTDPTANGGARQDRHSVADLLDRLRIGGRARWLLEARIESDYGSPVARLSLLYLTLSERLYWNQPAGGIERWRIKGGNSTLVDELTRRLVTPPMLQAPVTAIRWDGAAVEVDTDDGETLTGDKLVVAAPTAALRQIEFSPALPRREAGFIAAIDLCAVAKTLIQYERRIWRRQGRTGGSTTDLPIGQTWETTDQQDGAPGILIAYTAGRRGEVTATIDDRQRTIQAREDIDVVFPGTRRLAGDSFSVAWRAEPYSGGCWAVFRPGQVSKHWLGLHEPTGPIHWAGEHTERLNGYMNSAVASGMRVAGEIAG